MSVKDKGSVMNRSLEGCKLEQIEWHNITKILLHVYIIFQTFSQQKT